jgi:hypothetical protein
MATEEIRCLYDPWIRDGGKKSGPGSGIRILDEQQGSYFRELRQNSFLGL